MARPQEIDVDKLLDHARDLWTTEGMPAVTIRALSARSGVSNGAIYHHFSSRSHLLARVWAREAEQFRTFQRERIDAARTSGTAEDAVIAAALATGDYATMPGAAVRVLSASRPDSLSSDVVPEDLRAELRQHRRTAAALVAELARDVWGRDDEVACTLVRNCVVDIPARILMSSRTVNDPLARYAIEHAVRGVLSAGPPA